MVVSFIPHHNYTPMNDDERELKAAQTLQKYWRLRQQKHTMSAEGRWRDAVKEAQATVRPPHLSTRIVNSQDSRPTCNPRKEVSRLGSLRGLY